MKTPDKKKFSDLFTEEVGGDAPPSNVTANVARTGLLRNNKVKKKKQFSNFFA